jgi:hypothetical protein
VKIALCRRAISVDRFLMAEEVELLQAICAAVFTEEFSLRDRLTSQGLLNVPLWQQYEVVAVACEVFGMSGMDDAHWCSLGPKLESSIQPLKKWIDDYRRWYPTWDQERVEQFATRLHQTFLTQARRWREAIEKVRAFNRQRG